MTYALLIVCVALASGWGYTVKRFIDLIEVDRLAGDAERRSLLDRIQAPERAAQVALTQDLPPSPPAVGFDDDEAFHLAQQEATDGRSRSA